MLQKRTGKILSLLVALAVVFTTLPTIVFAEGEIPLGDSGSKTIAAFDELDDFTLYQGYDFDTVTLADLDLPETLTGTDAQGKAVAIVGVTWQSAPDFDPAIEVAFPGYIFTPVLPEGYKLADGVTAPVITVFIRPEGGVGIMPMDASGTDWTLTGGVLTISTNAGMADWISNGHQTVTNITDVTSVVIDDAVTSINDMAFMGYANITTVSIGSGVLSIGENAFEFCTSLAAIAIPDGVLSIGEFAFASCTKLADIAIPDSITSIGYDAFEFCTSLATVSIGSGVVSIGEGAFWGCTSLANVVFLGDTPPSIDDYIFFSVPDGLIVTVPVGAVPDYTAAFTDQASLDLLPAGSTIVEATDTTAPTPGGSGTITTASIAQNTLTLNWIKATDNVSAQSALKYYVYRSASGNISTAANCATNGTLLNAGGTADIATLSVTGLTANTTYYFNVVVEDEAGNEAAYTMKSQATTAAPTYSVTVGSGTGGGNYAQGATVTITANAAPTGQQFKEWNISPSVTFTDGTSKSSQTAKFTMPAQAVTVTATYEALPVNTYSITVQNDGNGTANANVNLATAGTPITLTATPNSGYQFKEWQVISGGATITGNGFTMPAENVVVKAIFELIPTQTYTLTVNAGAGGTVSGGGGFAANASVTVTATPNADYAFNYWTDSGMPTTGGGNVTTPTYTFLMPGNDVTLTANFKYVGGGGGGSSDSGSSSGGGGGGGGGITTSSPSNAPSNVSQNQATDAAQKAAAAAKAAGSGTATANMKNVGNIPLAALQAMAKAAGIPLKFQADSMNGNSVDVRITLDPAKSTKGLDLSASTTSERAKNTEAFFEKHFNNNTSVVSLGQQGSFGQPVEIAAKIDPKLDTKNLVFYSYDKATNTYKRIEKPAYWIDKNGYLHFTTEYAGDVVISDGPLERK